MDDQGKDSIDPPGGMRWEMEQFRPNACLNTSYKLLTGGLAGKISEHTLRLGILPAEQKSLCKGTRGCLDALTIDMAIADEVMRDKRSLSLAWVDYKKAYDLVPYCWVNAMLQAVQAPKPIRALMKQLSKMWATDLCLWTTEGPEHISIEMKSGIFQETHSPRYSFAYALPHYRNP